MGREREGEKERKREWERVRDREVSRETLTYSRGSVTTVD